MVAAFASFQSRLDMKISRASGGKLKKYLIASLIGALPARPRPPAAAALATDPLER